jgi:protein-tyrosine-phosphatase
VTEDPDLVVTVCDVAHEELDAVRRGATLLHWSIPDPARSEAPTAFDQALESIRDRIHALGPRVRRSRSRRTPS